MAGTTVWAQLSNEISKSDESKFKEKVISLLRILDPSFEECSDIPGADFVVKSSEYQLDWVVQCQAFDVECDLDENHALQIVSTTEPFISEGFTCHRYWVLHNHQNGRRGRGKFTHFLDKIDEYKASLEASGKIKNFRLLPRQDFIDEAENKFRSTLTCLLQEYSRRYRVDIENKLEFGKYYVPNVPAEEEEISFREHEPTPNLKQVASNGNQSVPELVISDRKDIRWTLMHGEAGAGKTTTALYTATRTDKIVFFVNCDILDFSSLHSGTNFLLEHILRALNILEKFENETDRELLYSLSGATLAKTIEHSEKHILVFDGLDENRFYSDPSSKGLKLLSDRLSDVHCPIILVTRTSHFKESLFTDLLTLNSSRGGSKARRKARALKLHIWSKNHVLQLIDKIIEDYQKKLPDSENSLMLLDSESFPRIQKFRCLFLDESYRDFYGELPLNPLFLQFILSDVVERDIQPVNRPTLIYGWVRRKIHRDLEKDNRPFLIEKKSAKDLTQSDRIKRDVDVDKILYIMELVSKDMTLSREDGTFTLKDLTDSQKVEEIAAKIFQVDTVRIIDVLLNSVLTSHATLTREKYRSTKHKITFIFKILQEYFLALFVVRNNEDFSKYPKSIISLCEEIMETDHEEELWMYLREDFDVSQGNTLMIGNQKYGLNALFGSKNPDRKGDIIFVHGLMGHATKTWHPGEKDDPESCWLGWLAKDQELSELGIWTFGYEAEPSAWKGRGIPLFDQSSPLLDDLDSRELGDKPIIFITHSLGGLLVKKMLETADKYPQSQKFIHQTKGIVFLATPHQGAHLAELIKNIGTLFARLEPIVNDLKANEPNLRSLNETYRQKCRSWCIETKVYFETESVRGVKVVEEMSSDPGLLDVKAFAVPGANHISIAKPESENSQVYRGVRKFIKDCLNIPVTLPLNLPKKVTEIIKVDLDDQL